MTYRLTVCPICHHVYCIEDGCPRCAQNAATERRVNPGAILALLLWPAAAHADAYQFGGSVVTFNGYEVTFTNGLTSTQDFALEFAFELTEGITIQVIMLNGMGDAPDVMYVIPPAGYFAVPESVTVDEHESGVIAIYGGVS